MAVEITPEKSMTLWGLETDLMEALAQVDAMVESGTIDRDLLTTIEQQALETAQKRDRCVKFLRWAKGNEDLLSHEIKRLQAQLGARERARQRFESYILAIMERWGAKRLDGETYRLLAVAKPSHVEPTPDVDLRQQDLRFVRERVTVEWDKRALKAALEAGEENVPATLVDGGFRLEAK
jgi:hypothetical protein